MKLIKDIRLEKLPYHTNIVIPCERDQNKAIEQLLEGINPIEPDKEYEVIIKEKKEEVRK